LKKSTVHLYADSNVLAERASIQAEFVFRRHVVYSVLVRYLAGCAAGAGRLRALEASAGVVVG